MPTMPKPLVSIVMPTYKTDYLDEAIRSALAQTYPAIEIIVSDNCPNEDVRDLIRRYPNIRYEANPIRGVYSNFRNAMRLARGKYVKFLLDDDLLAPHCVEAMVQCFAKFKGVTLVAGRYNKIDEKGRVTSLSKTQDENRIVLLPGSQAAREMLMTAKNFVGPLTTCMFRRNTLPLGIGPWFFHSGAPDQYFGLIDMTIILDIVLQGQVVLFPEPLSSMRFHEGQLSNASRNPRAVSTLKSWLPLAIDAHAFGLITDKDLQRSFKSLLKLYRRWVNRFPELQESVNWLKAKREKNQG